jgi:hypothetical protein
MTDQKPSAGDALVRGIIDEMAEVHLTPDARELALLDKARTIFDNLDALETTVAQTGLTYKDRDGVTRPSRLLSEIRSLTLVLTRCLAPIQMTPEKATKNPNKVRAGQASWAARSGRSDLRGAVPKAQ